MSFEIGAYPQLSQVYAWLSRWFLQHQYDTIRLMIDVVHMWHATQVRMRALRLRTNGTVLNPVLWVDHVTIDTI